MRSTIHTLRGLLAGTAALALAAPAFAQTAEEAQAQAVNEAADDDQGEVIIVTATKRASTVQDVPFSINAQTQEDIQRANASTLEDISRNVAGLAVQNLGPGQSQVSVRGVSAGQVVRDQPGVKEQVGVYLDESVISLSLFTPDFDLFDLNRVETLRGPQGTLFGSGSVGGTLRYITNQPKLNRTEGLAEANLVTVDEDDIGGHLKGAINLPIGQTAAVRIVGYWQKFPGFIDAVGPAAGKNVNDGTRMGTRISLLWQPIDNLKITPRVVWQKVEADGFNRQEVFNLYANEFTTPAYEADEREQYLLLREKFEDKTRLADLTLSYDFGGAEITSVTSHIKRDILVSRDASALTGSVSVDLGFPDAAVNLPSNLRDTTDLKQFTQELRVSSTGEGPFSWVVGGFYSKVDRFYKQRLPTPGYDGFTNAFFADACAADPDDCAVDNPFPTPDVPVTAADIANGFPADSPYNADLPYDIKQLAGFGEATYDFGQFKLTGGARVYSFKEERRFTSGGLFANGDDQVDKTKSSGVSPRLIATWEPSNNLSVNVQAAKGFRLGGVNDPLNLPLCSDEDEEIFGGFQSYDDETLWNYEVGAKYSRGPVTLNIAGFYTKIKDLQVTLDAGSCSSRIVFNVPKAHTAGVEFEFNTRIAKGFELSFAGSVLGASFDSTVRDGNGNVIGGIESGNRLPSVPRIQGAVAANYTTRWGAGDWSINASYQHVGNRYTQPSDQVNNPRDFVSGLPFNGATGAEVSTVNLKLPAYNLVNLSTGYEWENGLGVTVYVNNLFDENPLLSFDRERGGRARLGYNVGQPRTIGLTIRQKFGQ
jgi:iron complex outermembrane receptor protein